MANLQKENEEQMDSACIVLLQLWIFSERHTSVILNSQLFLGDL